MLLNNVPDTRTYRQTHKIPSPWAPVRAVRAKNGKKSLNLMHLHENTSLDTTLWLFQKCIKSLEKTFLSNGPHLGSLRGQVEAAAIGGPCGPPINRPRSYQREESRNKKLTSRLGSCGLGHSMMLSASPLSLRGAGS